MMTRIFSLSLPGSQLFHGAKNRYADYEIFRIGARASSELRLIDSQLNQTALMPFYRRVMLVVWQGTRRCLSCSGQRTNQGHQFHQKHRREPISEKLDRYHLVRSRGDAASLLELRPPRRLRKFVGLHPKSITKK